MPIIAYNMAKMKQIVFQDLFSHPKNGIIDFGAQMKGWPDRKSAYASSTSENYSADECFMRRVR